MLIFSVDIINTSSVWDATVVSPMEKVYEMSVDGEHDKIDDDHDAEDEEENSMEA